MQKYMTQNFFNMIERIIFLKILSIFNYDVTVSACIHVPITLFWLPKKFHNHTHRYIGEPQNQTIWYQFKKFLVHNQKNLPVIRWGHLASPVIPGTVISWGTRHLSLSIYIRIPALIIVHERFTNRRARLIISSPGRPWLIIKTQRRGWGPGAIFPTIIHPMIPGMWKFEFFYFFWLWLKFQLSSFPCVIPITIWAARCGLFCCVILSPAVKINWWTCF